MPCFKANHLKKMAVLWYVINLVSQPSLEPKAAAL
jgi:hypothetical protein